MEEFLGLIAEESKYIELKPAHSEALMKRRRKSKLTQIRAAKLLKSSQSRVAINPATNYVIPAAAERRAGIQLTP